MKYHDFLHVNAHSYKLKVDQKILGDMARDGCGKMGVASLVTRL